MLPFIVLAAFPILALIAIYHSYREANAEEKRQVTWPLWGLVIAIGAKTLCLAMVIAVMGWVTFNRGDLMAWRGVMEAMQIIPTIFTLATELQQTIVEAASAYSGGELEDDLTLVVVRITE